MRSSLRLIPVVFAIFALNACGGGGDDGDTPPIGAQPKRGDLLKSPPAKTMSYPPGALADRVAATGIGETLADLLLSPKCSIDVYHLEYRTAAPDDSLTPASGALMVPNDTSNPDCTGNRSIVLFAHGTSTGVDYNIADLQNNSEGVLIALAFAAQGYIVVAPNYVGYDTSTLGYHPYLVADQQSKDMIDSLTAARTALPDLASSDTTDGGKLFITGYSEGGYVAMATHRALQDAGETVTASAPMSGPYALSAFGDAIVAGQVSGGAPQNLTLTLTGYQKIYGDIYADPTDAFEAQYADGIDSLLPSSLTLSELRNQGKLPESHLFSSTPPAPEFASITPATTPTNLAPVFAIGFGDDNLITNDFRLAYLQDAQTNPDGGFPTASDNLPPASPANPLRVALKTNDLRNWTPTSPLLLCAGDVDPVVFYMNTQLMQDYWASVDPDAPVTVLDIDSDVTTDDPYEVFKEGFAVAKDAVRLAGGDDAVFEAYHGTLVAPFCLLSVKQFFDEH